MNMYNVLLRKIFFLLILGLLIVACKENEITDPIDTQPEMPPITSFQMNFDAFQEISPLSKSNGTDTAFTKSNWAWASLNGIVWQTLVSVGMAIPVAAFVESFNHDPQLQEDGRWLWTYEFTSLGGIKHTASLYANVTTSGFEWEMYISKEGVFEAFQWFTGKSGLFGTEGTWTLNFEPHNPTPWIEIEWERNPENNTGSIKYTNIIPGGADIGGYIFYGLTDDVDFDAFYEIFNKGKNNTTSIKWNRTTHEGRVMDANHFGNIEWHCWDANLDNIDCQ